MTAPDPSPGSADTSPAPVRAAEDQQVDRTAMIVDALRPVSLALAVLFAALTPFHLLTLSRAAGLQVAGLAGASAVLLGCLWLAMGSRYGPYLRARAPQVGAAIAALAVVNTLNHVDAVGQPWPTANVMAAVIGIGAVLSVRSYAIGLIALADVGWVVIAAQHGFGDDWQQSAAALTAGTVLAGVLHVVRYRTVSRLEDAKRQLAAVAVTDHLTGLNNRRGLLMAGQPLVDLSRREGSTATVLYVDLDGLKAINDAQGHAAGDRMIVATASVLSIVSRSSDVVARLGGDEFAVLLPGIGPQASLVFVARVQERLAQVGISASVGTSSLDPMDPEEVPDLEGLLARADAAMYAAKRNQRPR